MEIVRSMEISGDEWLDENGIARAREKHGIFCLITTNKKDKDVIKLLREKGDVLSYNEKGIFADEVAVVNLKDDMMFFLCQQIPGDKKLRLKFYKNGNIEMCEAFLS